MILGIGNCCVNDAVSTSLQILSGIYYRPYFCLLAHLFVYISKISHSIFSPTVFSSLLYSVVEEGCRERISWVVLCLSNLTPESTVLWVIWIDGGSLPQNIHFIKFYPPFKI